MAAVLEPPAQIVRSIDHPGRRRWTRDDVAKMAQAGLIDIARCELIDGVLIEKMAKNRPHINVLTYLIHWLAAGFGFDRVNVEAAIDLSPEEDPTSEPEPDAIVLAYPTREFGDANPKPSGILLLIEVSDTTLDYDRTTKARLYSRAGIADFWIFDVRGKQLIVHRDPGPEGYRSVTAYSGQEAAAPLAAPHHALTISTLFE